jgi:hypothetical protein
LTRIAIREARASVRMLQLKIEQKLLAPRAELYEFHLRRCDRVVAAVFARMGERSR